ncbi:hypothetical protein C8F01DRAFT_1266359 [Mycena amicta]|nr:hypothetical protein C8F01DRAFT_1266359 [Mycena amicta]
MASSSAGTSTISPTKGTRRSNPLDEVHLEELLARLQKRSREDNDELEVVSERISDKTGLKRRRASASSTVESKTVWSSFRQTKHTTRDTVAQGGEGIGSTREAVPAASARKTTASREVVPAVGAKKTTTELRELADGLHAIAEGHHRPPRTGRPTPDQLRGLRHFPEGFPTPDGLYRTDVRPGPLLNVLPIYKCVCCGKVKSCPVWFPNCKHSGCYVCTFLHLEHNWDCPECARPMYEAPRRDCALEEEIRHRYPEWTDGSVVTYSFARFTFPRRPVA